jgi:molybdate transport system substrate-binding protein
MAPRELLAELSVAFARDSGIAVAAEATGGVDAARRIAQGERLDVVVLARDAIDKLAAAGHLCESSSVDLVQSAIAVAVRAGASRPDISDEAAVRRAVLAAGRVAYSTGPSGSYMEQLFARWGVLPQLRPRIVVPPPGVPVGTLLARGDCDLAFQQQSELMNLPGIALLGTLPAAIQYCTSFSGAIAASSTEPKAAALLLGYLAAAEQAVAKQRHGFSSGAAMPQV